MWQLQKLLAVKRVRATKPVEGQAMVAAVFFIIMGFMLLGFVIEVGHIMLVKRQLQNDAYSGATYGAMQIDYQGVRDSQGIVPDVMPPGGASWAGPKIADYMTAQGYDAAEWNWQWGRCALQVNLEHKVDTIFIKLLGINQVTVKVEGKSKLSNSDNPNGCG